MGNSASGQAPSEVLKVIFTFTKGETPPEKFDLNKLKKACDLELKMFASYMTIIQIRLNQVKLDIETINAFVDTCKEVNDILFELTGNSKFNHDADKYADMKTQFRNVPTEDSDGPEMALINSQIMMLDIVFGRKQTEYAETLLNRGDSVDSIREIYANETNGLARRLQAETVQEVEPCQGALTMWHSWSI